MRRILHVSDLHFGRTNERVVAALIEIIDREKPDVLVVSGDLTQRARDSQFEEARRFLDHFDCPRVVVPGNHDIPLHNVFRRVLTPMLRYRKHISENLSPTYEDEEIAILGVNTARFFRGKGGSISDRQVQEARRFFCAQETGIVKIIVTHHPLDLVRARRIFAVLAECHADLFLAGHSHVPSAGLTEHRFTVAHHTALIVEAGTSVSTRIRSEPNSFNLIHIQRPSITVEHFYWMESERTFKATTATAFLHNDRGWQQVPA